MILHKCSPFVCILLKQTLLQTKINKLVLILSITPKYLSYITTSCLVQVLILHGVGDRLVPVSNSRRLAKLMPGAELLEYTNCGHVPQEELPKQFIQSVKHFVGQCWNATKQLCMSSGHALHGMQNCDLCSTSEFCSAHLVSRLDLYKPILILNLFREVCTYTCISFRVICPGSNISLSFQIWDQFRNLLTHGWSLTASQLTWSHAAPYLV